MPQQKSPAPQAPQQAPQGFHELQQLAEVGHAIRQHGLNAGFAFGLLALFQKHAPAIGAIVDDLRALIASAAAAPAAQQQQQQSDA
jgi:hypothetical protein